jgi:hypothetical protein
MPILYHTTHKKAADAIIRGGFKDATGYYMTTEEWTGVWLADQPLDINEGADGDTLLEVEFDDLAPLEDHELVEDEDHELVEDGKPYREWLVPAALVNSIGRVRIWGPRADYPSWAQREIARLQAAEGLSVEEAIERLKEEVAERSKKSEKRKR